MEQTAGRAELRAALAAFEWAREPTEVVSDNDRVVKGTYRVILGGSKPGGAHQDLWDRMGAAIKKLGAGGASIRWTKGHATQEHIDQGLSNPEDQHGNFQADHLATMAQSEWKVEGTIEGYFRTRRRAARTMQRMMIECAIARKEEMIRRKEAKEDEDFLKIMRNLMGEGGGRRERGKAR